ncbi:MAG: hypothetical protein HKL85_07410 [Acidimicrobiaceae bacterium]|nr:hypothetical protein [Acidimicrobiaceae bacterium]
MTTSPCAQGTGTNSTSATWAVVAAQRLGTESAQTGLHFNAPDVVACTGAVSGQFFNSYGNSSGAEWIPSMGRFDLVTFSFGGDDINFSGIISQCVSQPLPGIAKSDPHHSCPSDAYIRGLISRKLGSQYQNFLTKVANSAVVSGGNIVVMGYPELIDLPKFWPKIFQHLGFCQGIGTGDAIQLRGDAGALNAAIGNDVAVVNTAHPNGVHLTFINPVSGDSANSISPSDPLLFEPSTGTRHELCSPGNDSWMNGLSIHLQTRSFHPNQAGETSMGELAATVIARLSFESAAKSPPPLPKPQFTIGSAFNDYCGVAWPSAPLLTSTSITMTMSCNSVPENRFLFTEVIFGDPRLGVTPNTGLMHVVGRIVDIATSQYGFHELVVVASSVTL